MRADGDHREGSVVRSLRVTPASDAVPASALPRRALVLTAVLDALAAPLDRVRRAWLRLLAPRLRAMLVEREVRVAVAACSVVATSLAGAVLAPVWLLALGPLALGVAHLLVGLRYLVVRTELHRRTSAWLAIGVPVVLSAWPGVGLRVGWLAVAGALFCARGASPARRWLPLVPLAGVYALTWWAPEGIPDVVFAHAHNLIALVLLGWWRPRTRRIHVVPLALFLLASAWIIFGNAEALVTRSGAWHPRTFAVPLGELLQTYAPMPEHIDLARRLTLFFAFAQSVHYGIWLRLVPEEARRSATPRSFRQSGRALVREVGPGLVALTLALFAGLFALAFWRGADVARMTYFRLALYHGPLEVAVAALLFAEGRRLA